MIVIPVMFCWNGNRGLFSGRLERIDFRVPNDATVELEGPTLKVERTRDKYRPTEQNFRICKSNPNCIQKRWEYFRPRTYATWVGNWHWDQCGLTLPDFFKLIEFLRARNWQPICSGVDFAEVWEQGTVKAWVEKKWAVPA